MRPQSVRSPLSVVLAVFSCACIAANAAGQPAAGSGQTAAPAKLEWHGSSGMNHLRPLFSTYVPRVAWLADNGMNVALVSSVNDLAAPSGQFPTALTVTADLYAAGGEEFSIYEPLTSWAPGVVTHEDDCFNKTNVDAQNVWPLNRSFGLNSPTCVGLTLGAGAGAGSTGEDDALAIDITTEGTSEGFHTKWKGGVYMHSDSCSNFAYAVGSSNIDTRFATIFCDGTVTVGEPNAAATAGVGQPYKGASGLNVAHSDTVGGFANVSAVFGVDLEQTDATGANLVLGVGGGTRPFIAPTRYGARLLNEPPMLIFDADGNASIKLLTGGITLHCPAGCDLGGATTAPVFIGQYIRTTPTTFSGLASADPSPVAGDRAFVTDAAICAFARAVPAGGGSNECPVVYTGTGWIAG